MSDTDRAGFNTPAHISAQAACNHLIRCAVDGETRETVMEAIAYGRRVGDPSHLPIRLAQLSGPCVIPPDAGVSA